MSTPNNREVVMREIITTTVRQLNKRDGFLLSNIFYICANQLYDMENIINLLGRKLCKTELTMFELFGTDTNYEAYKNEYGDLAYRFIGEKVSEGGRSVTV